MHNSALVLGLVGATKLVCWPLIASALLWHHLCLEYLFLLRIPSVLLVVAILYGHEQLAKEIYQGILTHETYPRENYCLCFNLAGSHHLP